jgi:single-strand DNA-binding protein
MNDLNRTCLVGRISRDSILRVNASGTSICDFSVAVNRSRKNKSDEWEDVPHFFTFNIFGTRAEGMHEYLVKGQTVSIEGHLEMMTYERDGYKNSRMVLSVDDIRLIGPHKKAEKHEEAAEAQKETAAGTHPDAGDSSAGSDEFPEFPELTDDDLDLGGLEGEPNV